jgi:hypothetical protein
MADKKISELESALTLNSVDYLVVVQSGETKKIDVGTMSSNLPKALVVKEAAIAPASGPISTTAQFVNIIANNNTFSLAAGAHGASKTIVCSSVTAGGAVATITVTGGLGFNTITLDAVGETVVLHNVNGSWYVAGTSGTGIVSYG